MIEPPAVAQLIQQMREISDPFSPEMVEHYNQHQAHREELRINEQWFEVSRDGSWTGPIFAITVKSRDGSPDRHYRSGLLHPLPR